MPSPLRLLIRRLGSAAILSGTGSGSITSDSQIPLFGGNMPTSRFPDDMIDAERLFELFGYVSADPDQIGETAYAQLLDFETAVDHLYLKGGLKRFSAKDAKTGEVVAHAFRRADIQQLLQSSPAFVAMQVKL